MEVGVGEWAGVRSAMLNMDGRHATFSFEKIMNNKSKKKRLPVIKEESIKILAS